MHACVLIVVRLRAEGTTPIRDHQYLRQFRSDAGDLPPPARRFRNPTAPSRRSIYEVCTHLCTHRGRGDRTLTPGVVQSCREEYMILSLFDGRVGIGIGMPPFHRALPTFFDPSPLLFVESRSPTNDEPANAVFLENGGESA